MKTDKTRGLRFVQDEEKDVTSLKKALRARMRRSRAEIVNRDVKENLIRENILSILSEIEKSKGAGTRLRCFVYLSYSSEFPTDNLITDLLNREMEVYCPRIEQGGMSAVQFSEDFTLTPQGIREPTGGVYGGEMDVAITPLLAVDKQGNRLGYGGGYYDRYFQKHGETLRIGCCFDGQVIDRVPTADSDVPLQYIVTEKQIIRITIEK